MRDITIDAGAGSDTVAVNAGTNNYAYITAGTGRDSVNVKSGKATVWLRDQERDSLRGRQSDVRVRKQDSRDRFEWI